MFVDLDATSSVENLGKMAISCPLCQVCSFSHIEGLAEALLKFVKIPVFCPLCNCPCQDFSQLAVHLVQNCTVLLIEKTFGPQTESKKSPVSSPFRHQSTENSLSETSLDNSDSQFKCKQCSTFRAPDFDSLRRHTEISHPEKKFICNICCKAFKVSPSLSVHLKVAHDRGAKFSCAYCQRLFATKSRKEQHEKTHCNSPKQRAHSNPRSPGEGTSSSSACLNDTDAALRNGESCTQPAQTYSCAQCGKTFKKEQYLLQHLKTHDSKRCQCPVCHKSFTTKEYLKKHSRLHTGETPYCCDVCGKTFTLQQSYHKHVLYHSDDRPYVCSHCGRKFKELTTLHNHERIHTGEKPYICETCGKAFRQRVSYVVHRRIHTGALPYVCTACGKSFRYKVSQRTHKCPGDTEPSVVRCRPSWLERLLTCQTDPDPATVAAQTTAELTAEAPVSLADDSLHTIDLSSLTLTFDQDLNF